MECLVVWLAMAVGTLRHIAVLALVAGDAGYSPVLAGTIRQFGEYFAVTGTARVRRHIRTEHDLSWLVNRMALEAHWNCLPGSMRFVAGKAGRFEAV